MEALSGLRNEFRAAVDGWTAAWPGLMAAQQAVADSCGYAYRVETPIVYNKALDALGAADSPRIVLVADNPGLNEQKAEKRAYLVGQSGKLAEGLFRRELSLDFRRDCLILNKTPVHSPKTKELSLLPPEFRPLLAESQRFMAGLALRTAAALGAEIWVTGYSEIGAKGLFSVWAEEFRLRAAELKAAGALPPVMVYRHFSMNQFSYDLKTKRREGESAKAALKRIGADYRREKLGMEGQSLRGRHVREGTDRSDIRTVR